jgi:CSLREA domain-containing protein
MRSIQASNPSSANRRPRRRPTPLAALAVIGALALIPAAAQADTFEVTTRADDAPGSCTADDCTLREAVIAATALDGDDKIKLPKKKAYKLTRSSTLPGPDDAKGDLDAGTMFTLGNGLTIVHPGGGRTTIDASGADDRAIQEQGLLRLTKVNVRGGVAASGSQSGGAIYGDGSVLVRRSRIVGNEAPDAGGGVYMVHGGLYTTRAKVQGNTAGEGGGAFAEPQARLNLTKTTVRHNQALTGDGGGAWTGTNAMSGGSSFIESTVVHNEAAGDGGGIYGAADVLEIENSTLAHNDAAGRGGGIYSDPDSGTLINNATIARNRADLDDSGGPDTGGGIFADGGDDVVEIRNSLVTKNRTTGGAVNECYAPAPVGVASLGGNLITSTAGCPFFDHAQDIVSDAPKLAQLADNGGPTQTVALKAGSPAINQADGPNPLERDQRGQLRQNPDIGAYER